MKDVEYVWLCLSFVLAAYHIAVLGLLHSQKSIQSCVPAESMPLRDTYRINVFCAQSGMLIARFWCEECACQELRL